MCTQPKAQAPEQRDHFAKLARTWIKLAEELEQAEALLAVIEEDDSTKQTGKKGPRTSKERGLKVRKNASSLASETLGYPKGDAAATGVSVPGDGCKTMSNVPTHPTRLVLSGGLS